MDLYFKNSPTNHFPSNNHSVLDSSHDGPSYTRDGWSFKENKIYESATMNFEDTTSMTFFEHVALLMPWKTIESIINHRQILMEDMKLIKSSDGKFEDIVEADNEMEEETKKVTRRAKKKAIPWTIDEHKLFLIGLQEEGKGEWKAISKKYLPNKTPSQIASHAQKFEKRMHTKTPPEKRRTSINDIKLSPKPNLSLDSDDFQSSKLGFGFFPKSHDFPPNQVAFTLDPQNFKPNQVTFPLESQYFQPHQPSFPLDSQSFQPNHFNFDLDFQPNKQLGLSLNSRNFVANQFVNDFDLDFQPNKQVSLCLNSQKNFQANKFENDTSYDHVHNYI